MPFQTYVRTCKFQFFWFCFIRLPSATEWPVFVTHNFANLPVDVFRLLVHRSRFSVRDMEFLRHTSESDLVQMVQVHMSNMAFSIRIYIEKAAMKTKILSKGRLFICERLNLTTCWCIVEAKPDSPRSF